MEVREYLRIFRRRWMLILSSVVITVGLGSLITLNITPEYASTARLFVSAAQSQSDQAYAGGLFSQQRVKSYADLLSGVGISKRVVERLELDQSPRDLANQISAEVGRDTVVLSVTVRDPDPARAKQLALAVSEVFVEYVAELETPPGKDAAPIKATLVDEPNSPTSPVTPKPVRNIALALVLGLMVGVILSILRDILDTSIKNADDIDNITGAPILGGIQFDQAAIENQMVTNLNGHAPRVEAFRVLRTNLQFVDAEKGCKVYVVTSSMPGEGKTSTAANLAAVIAASGLRVALVEADMRRPRLASYLSLEGSVGLTTVLIGRCELDEALQEWGSVSLDVLTSGRIPPNPAELLQADRMTDILNDLRGRYDVVLIDAPPLLPVADGAILASKVDGAILVVQHGKTTKDQLKLAVERVHAVGGRIVGTVFNMTPPKGRFGYGYGYGYGYAPDETHVPKRKMPTKP